MSISLQSDNLSTRLVAPLPYFDQGSILVAEGKGAELGAGRRSAREKQWQRWVSNLSKDEWSVLARGLITLINVVKKETERLTQQSIDFEPLPAKTSQCLLLIKCRG